MFPIRIDFHPQIVPLFRTLAPCDFSSVWKKIWISVQSSNRASCITMKRDTIVKLLKKSNLKCRKGSKTSFSLTRNIKKPSFFRENRKQTFKFAKRFFQANNFSKSEGGTI